MKLQNQIDTKVREALAPTHLELENESRRHNVPPGSETHFKLVVVSGKFEGKGLVDRHRTVYALLTEEMKQGGVHALALHTYTPAEWAGRQGAAKSPPCASGDKE